jgi:Tfp pilus assembly protein PilF
LIQVGQFSCVNKIRERVELINNYFLSVALVDNTYGLLQSINLNDIESFRLHQKKLDDADLKLVDLEKRNYYNLLQLANYDPAQFNRKINECRNLSNTIRQQYNQMMMNLYAMFYNRGVDFLRAGNIQKAEQYFHFSLELNPSFAPSLLQLGVIDFRRDNLMEAICKSDDILYNLYPDPETKQRTFDLIRDVYEKRIELGNSYLKVNKDYYKAVDQFEEARRICEKYSAVRCDDELFNGIRISKNGIYQDHLNHGRVAIQQNNLADADEAWDNAIRYQSLNAREITDNSEALTLKKVIRQRYYDQKIAEAKKNTLVKNYVTALLNFDEAEQMLKDYNLFKISSLSNTRIKISLRLNSQTNRA